MSDENILNGGPAVNVPKVSLGEFLLQQLQARGNDVAQIDAETGETQTFPQILTKTIIIAQKLLQLGIRPGDVVGISSENSLDYCLPVIASLYVGAVCAPYNPAYTEAELLHSMSVSRPRIVFASALTIGKVKAVADSMDCVRNIVLIGRNPAPTDIGRYSIMSEFFHSNLHPSVFIPARVNPEKDTAIILSSSGTTGLPKGVELTHANFLYFVHVMMDSATIRMSEDSTDVIPGLMPFYHGYGFGLFTVSVAVGIKMVVLPRFEENMFLRAVQDFKITALYLVPPLMVFLGKHPSVGKYDLSHVKTIVSGAAPLSKDAQEAVTQRLGVQDIRQGYGMTETSVLATSCREGDVLKMGSSGTVIKGVIAKIIDLESGKSLPRYKEGEVCFKGPNVMKGYRGNPKATAETIDADGWLHTGDIGYFDSDGHLFVVDRLKELIKYKGFQVAPAELEAVLYTHKGIRDAAVVGMKDEMAGELPLAFVVLQPNVTLTETEIMDYVSQRVSPQKKLRGGVRFVSEIPRNPSGKILRRELRSKL